MPRLTIPLALCLAVSVLLIGGCGGGGGSDEHLSKAEFIKQADALCLRMDNRLLRMLNEFAKRYPEIAKGPTAKVATTKFVSAIALPEIQKEAEGIAALPAPKGDEKELKTFVSEIEAAVKETEKGDVSRVFTNDRGRFQRVYHLGTAYGFKVCNEAL